MAKEKFDKSLADFNYDSNAYEKYKAAVRRQRATERLGERFGQGVDLLKKGALAIKNTAFPNPEDAEYIVVQNDNGIGTRLVKKPRPNYNPSDYGLRPVPKKIANIPPDQGAPVDKTEPETPGAGAQESAAEAPPVPASDIVKPPSQRELLIKEAKTKYKDSPFKQWAHANQKLAMALKPGQVGYAQVQEYFKEQGKNGKLKVKPQEKPFIKTNTINKQMGDGVTDLPGYSMSSSPIV